MMGGKGLAGLYQWIINQMPPHTIYVELFAGNAAIMRRKATAPVNFAVEIDAVAAAQLTLQRSMILPRSTESPPDLSIIQESALDWLPRICLPPKALIYADPPYPHSTRGQHRYPFDMSDQQHAELLRILVSQKCQVMISTYPNNLYAQTLKLWRSATRRVITRGHTTALETLYMNYPEPTTLHDYHYLGRDRRDRERILRRQKRWLRRLFAMPPLERAALQHALRTAVDRH